MASSIDAITSGAGGVVTTADNTGILQLKSGGTTIATVSSTGLALNTGNITLPSGAAPTFSAYHSTTQSISSTTWTKCTFNTERFDTNSNYDNATNYRFTPTVAGYYIITSTIASESSLSYLYLELRKNGASEILSIGTATNATGTCVTGVMYLNGSTDYVEAWCFASSGCNLANAAYKTFTGAMIRSA